MGNKKSSNNVVKPENRFISDQIHSIGEKNSLNFFSSGFKKSDFKYLKLIVNRNFESVWVVKKKGSGQIYLLKEVSKIE